MRWRCSFPLLLVVLIASSCGSPAESVVDDGGLPGSSGASSGSGSGSGSSSGSSGTSGSSSSGGPILGSSSGMEAGLSDATLHNDGAPQVDGMACVQGDAGPPLYPQRCITMTANECDGPTDTALTSLGVAASLLNGTAGNGFDDDCDGQVDEGCGCPGNGQTKPCFLVPATQVDPSTKEPVGWCTTNSLGSLDCAGIEFPLWSGVCRGAQPPYPDDICAPGDFNCDGLPENSHTTNCTCQGVPVECPTAALTEQPYPDPMNIPIIDGSQWIVDPAQRPNAMNWAWTVIGGDCDNVLPHPTFAIYNQANSTAANARQGTRTPVVFSSTAAPPRYVAMAGQPLISIQAANYGNGVAGGQVHPAFGLSGDYVVQGEWDLNGTHYVCTQKVQVRAPGIRAELCWDTVGGLEATNAAGNNLDLHLARLQNPPCAPAGWDSICNDEDCYYANTNPTDWGYAASAVTACNGWSSRGSFTGGNCTNPRLDLDNVACDKTDADPTDSGNFCSPENINLDNPKDGDRFAVAVNHYGNTAGTSNAHPHVDIYCNGARVLSVGYNPLTGQLLYPLLKNAGDDYTGDFWEVAMVTAHVSGAQLASCDVTTVPSHHADQQRDGPTTPTTAGNQLCVDSQKSDANPVYNYKDHRFLENEPLQGGTAGGIPAMAAEMCKH